MGMEIEGDGRARISSTRSGSRSHLASCTSWQSRQPEKLHLSLQQYQLLNKAHKTRYASKSSHNIHKTSLKDNSKNARSDRNVVKGARAARIQQNKCELLDLVVAEATLDFRNLNKRKLLTNFPTFLPQAWLLILYTGLALRENILRVNGSDIRPWWIKHHYFAMAMALISLTWETQKQRGVQLFLQWAIMQGAAMLLQNRYQRQRLCTHIALSKARRMDVVWGETAGVDGQLWLLAPILFILQGYDDILKEVLDPDAKKPSM